MDAENIFHHVRKCMRQKRVRKNTDVSKPAGHYKNAGLFTPGLVTGLKKSTSRSMLLLLLRAHSSNSCAAVHNGSCSDATVFSRSAQTRSPGNILTGARQPVLHRTCKSVPVHKAPVPPQRSVHREQPANSSH